MEKWLYWEHCAIPDLPTCISSGLSLPIKRCPPPQQMQALKTPRGLYQSSRRCSSLCIATTNKCSVGQILPSLTSIQPHCFQSGARSVRGGIFHCIRPSLYKQRVKTYFYHQRQRSWPKRYREQKWVRMCHFHIVIFQSKTTLSRLLLLFTSVKSPSLETGAIGSMCSERELLLWRAYQNRTGRQRKQYYPPTTDKSWCPDPHRRFIHWLGEACKSFCGFGANELPEGAQKVCGNCKLNRLSVQCTSHMPSFCKTKTTFIMPRFFLPPTLCASPGHLEEWVGVLLELYFALKNFVKDGPDLVPGTHCNSPQRPQDTFLSPEVHEPC